jgi:hypothetical protein
VSTAPHLQTQLQKVTNWLSAEHLQHQQWVSMVIQQDEQSSVYACQSFCDPHMTEISPEYFIQFTPPTGRSSKLVHSPVSFCNTYSVFPGLKLPTSFVDSVGVQPFERQQGRHTRLLTTSLVNVNLRLFLMKFRAWFQFATLYLSAYVQKICLQEEARLSDSFSSCLICKWLQERHITAQFKYPSPPFVGPTQAEVHNHLNRIKEQMKRLKAVSQSYLITQLNSHIRQWVSLWDVSARWQTLRYCDDRLRRFLQRWAKRRHPNKGWGWVCHKYWRMGTRSTQFLFWFGLLAQAWSPSRLNSVFRVNLKSHVMTLLATKVRDCMDLEPSILYPWQFFCIESNEVLVTYSTFTLKKWRKSRAFDYFLLY